MIATTSKDDPEHQALLNAKNAIDSVVAGINEEKSLRENSEKILELQRYLDPSGEFNIFVPNRKFLFEGVLGLCTTLQELKDGKIKVKIQIL